MGLDYIISKPRNFFAVSRLRLEITILILIKLFLLFILWKLCFAHPLPPISAQAFTQHFFEPIVIPAKAGIHS